MATVKKTPLTRDPKYRKGIFYLWEEPIFNGYTSIDDMYLWNGWSCPNFDFNTAKKILDAVSKSNLDSGVKVKWGYNKENDAFWYWDDTYEGDEKTNCDTWKGEDIIVDGKTIRVYDIGSHSWCWSEMECHACGCARATETVPIKGKDDKYYCKQCYEELFVTPLKG